MAKYYKSNTARAKAHRKLYDKFVSKGMSYKKAYELASKLTNWA